MDFTHYEKQLIDQEASEMVAKPPRIPIRTRMYEGHGPDYYWGFDLIDFHDSYTVQQNRDYKFIMICQDIYSKYVFARALKEKTAREIIEAFKDIFNTNADTAFGISRVPTFLCSDEESAITGDAFKAFARSMDINVYHAWGKNGVAPVESFIRTFKEKLAFYWTRQRRNWIDHYEDIIANYNNCKHSGLVNSKREYVTPHDVYFEGVQIKENSAYAEHPRTKHDLSIGDLVRFRINKDLSSVKKKSLLPNYSIDVYEIVDINTTNRKGRNRIPNVGYRLERRSNNHELVDLVDPVFGQELRNADKRLFYRNELKKSRMDASEIQTLNNVTKTLLRAQNNAHAILDNMDALGPEEVAVARAVNREAAELAQERIQPQRRRRGRPRVDRTQIDPDDEYIPGDSD